MDNGDLIFGILLFSLLLGGVIFEEYHKRWYKRKTGKNWIMGIGPEEEKDTLTNKKKE